MILFRIEFFRDIFNSKLCINYDIFHAQISARVFTHQILEVTNHRGFEIGMGRRRRRRERDARERPRGRIRTCRVRARGGRRNPHAIFHENYSHL